MTRRRLNGDRGSVTIESAIAIGAIFLVVGLAIAGFQAVLTQLRCVDAAQEAARLIARGEPERAEQVVRTMVPNEVQLSTRFEGDAVRVEVVARPLGKLLPFPLRGTAFALLEQPAEQTGDEIPAGRLPASGSDQGGDASPAGTLAPAYPGIANTDTRALISSCRIALTCAGTRTLANPWLPDLPDAHPPASQRAHACLPARTHPRAQPTTNCSSTSPDTSPSAPPLPPPFPTTGWPQ
ncbi:TadE family type IV pilus minor pilin [Crossiella sp. CA-258035]|uniref:TadE family type IV pilus minor pilin n=1 Tax=Crossiella sp. CA-258035 TaxID=2981138 RepID=UPI0024BBF7C6|nr:TadE family type IV pilus minor pilin [Crossiella sp. CA-258035]WHT19789.1 TadE family type IV pilus minor pilin [Crossiella sp. CA-258035]